MKPQPSQNLHNLEIINESAQEPDEASLYKAFELVCREEIPQREANICLLICESARMRKLNRIYRGSDQDTDVLSFSSDFTDAVGSKENDQPLRGDIVVDINQADKQKDLYGLDLELQKLVIHGMLHLLGYDHIKKQDKDIMEQKESYYYDKLRRTQQGG